MSAFTVLTLHSYCKPQFHKWKDCSKAGNLFILGARLRAPFCLVIFVLVNANGVSAKARPWMKLVSAHSSSVVLEFMQRPYNSVSKSGAAQNMNSLLPSRGRVMVAQFPLRGDSMVLLLPSGCTTFLEVPFISI